MKKITIGMFSLAALVAMATISAKTVRAEAGASPEQVKQESGIEFGEMGELKGRGGSSAVSALSASGSSAGRPALTLGKPDMKAMRARSEVPTPGRDDKAGWGGGEGPLIREAGLVANGLWLAGGILGLLLTAALVLSGVVGQTIVGVLGFVRANHHAEASMKAGEGFKTVAAVAGLGFLEGVLTFANHGANRGYAIGQWLESKIGRIG